MLAGFILFYYRKFCPSLRPLALRNQLAPHFGCNISLLLTLLPLRSTCLELEVARKVWRLELFYDPPMMSLRQLLSAVLVAAQPVAKSLNFSSNSQTTSNIYCREQAAPRAAVDLTMIYAAGR